MNYMLSYNGLESFFSKRKKDKSNKYTKFRKTNELFSKCYCYILNSINYSHYCCLCREIFLKIKVVEILLAIKYVVRETQKIGLNCN